jgi:RNA polymerase sigma-70 factor, ECF subfamily
VQDEQKLVFQAQKCDQEAFAQLYEQNFDKIYRYIALKVGNKTEAEDMTQQVFIKALQSISSYKWKDVPFSAWLFRIAHNQVIDYYRKQTRQATTPLYEFMAVSDCSPEKSVEIKSDIERLLLASKKLTPAQQEVISLRFAGELPIIEVARIMGKTQGAVKALQHSAIIALRKLMLVEENVKE